MVSKAEPLAWITGAGGLIGSWLARTAPKGWTVRALTKPELELSDFATVCRVFRSEQPALVIHCAALSRSTDCQANPALARTVNVDVTSHLAKLAAAIPFFFFSTDLVFDGRSSNYDESAPVNPLGVYAETKVAAEQFVLRNPGHTVIRTSLNAGPSPSGDRGFDEQILRAWRRGQKLRFFTDEFRCPIPAEVTARAVWELARKNVIGLFHIAGAERLSRWQIGQALAARWPELQPKFEPGSLAELQGATRAADTSLNCAKAQRLIPFKLPRWSEWVRHPCFSST